MNYYEQVLFEEISNGDMQKIKKAAIAFLKNNKVKKHEDFCNNILKKIESYRSFIDMPYDLKGILVCEDTSNYPTQKMFFRNNEIEIYKKINSMYKVSGKLQSMGIKYNPFAILYGESGCGKTELARYISHMINIPYVYVRFSALIDSYLGNTNKNISKIFDYIKKEPCLLCFDEIDAIGMKRGSSNEVGEMSRIVISLMQELDSLNNNVVVIGTTNRLEIMDDALIRRFPLKYKIDRLNEIDAKLMATKFLNYANVKNSDIENYLKNINGNVTANTIIKNCTEFLVDKILFEELSGENQ